jgi:hypothetical protein
MTRARASLLLLLAVATVATVACETQKKPIRGFDKQPPGSILLDNLANGGTGAMSLWALFDVPLDQQPIFRARFNGQDAVISTSKEEGFYDYATLYVQGWTGAWPNEIRGVPPGSYVVEIVDGSGKSWGQSPPLTVFELANVYSPGVQIPVVVFVNLEGKVGSWTVDPLLQDADPATDEITVSNVVDEDVVVERCLIPSGTAAHPASCTPVGTVAPGADLHTVETVAGSSTDEHQALRIRLASDGSQAYLRELDEGSGNFGNASSLCQVERIIVHGKRSGDIGTSPDGPSIAVSTCYGYQSGPS